ncbi:hypothetical protein COE51_01720 [Bacillus pseudomycoides]|nr:hypothetical protein COE51_01720 [Bacillus pseudomycoides]
MMGSSKRKNFYYFILAINIEIQKLLYSYKVSKKIGLFLCSFILASIMYYVIKRLTMTLGRILASGISIDSKIKGNK